MVHRGTTRETKRIRVDRISSTPDAKQRRHKNKARIWRRAVKRLELELRYNVPAERPISMGLSSA
jgi:hypothetical protein